MTDFVLDVKDLRRSYGELEAVRGVSFQVASGEIFGMVGPNGAGKTTTVECIEGLRTPTTGDIELLGMNPAKQGEKLKKRIGMQLQEAALPDRLLVWEALALFASLYKKTLEPDALLASVGLAEKKRAAFSKLSGGQKQRLFVALAMLNDPEVVFLDELTTGLDPHARRMMWELVENLRDRGKTIVLTTHFMEEAQRLCDRVAILDKGQIIALDSPANLIRQLGVEQCVSLMIQPEKSLEALEQLESVQRVERSGEKVRVYGSSEELVVHVVQAMVEAQIPIRELQTEQATLEDVYLHVTGQAYRKNGEAAA